MRPEIEQRDQWRQERRDSGSTRNAAHQTITRAVVGQTGGNPAHVLLSSAELPRHHRARAIIRLAAFVLVIIASMWVGAVGHDTWIRSHPCYIAPGGEIRDVVVPEKERGAGGGDRRLIMCGADGEAAAIIYYNQKDGDK